MAGDWIKMRHDLGSDPAVIGIAAHTGLDEDSVVGKLHRLWSWANSQTVDGNAPCVTKAWIDRYLTTEGFADAMISVGWLIVRSGGITIPNFDRHNSESAKKRALSAVRVARHKARKGNATSVSDALPREEKRRVKNPPNPPKGGTGCVLPEVLNTERFRCAWADWCAHRKQLGIKRYTEIGRAKQFKRLAEMGHDRAIAAIEFSIANNYQGIIDRAENGRTPAAPSEHPVVVSDDEIAAKVRQRRESEKREEESCVPSEEALERLRGATHRATIPLTPKEGTHG